ncbi:MAG: light-harvesting antenna LH1, beta subunit [Myxococcota bacterium]
MAEPQRALSGLTDEEAKEFHSGFIMAFITFVVIAIIAHLLTWMWRPWFAGPDGYSMIQDAQTVAESAMNMLV